jgi:hypothetical protein
MINRLALLWRRPATGGYPLHAVPSLQHLLQLMTFPSCSTTYNCRLSQMLQQYLRTVVESLLSRCNTFALLPTCNQFAYCSISLHFPRYDASIIPSLTCLLVYLAASYLLLSLVYAQKLISGIYCDQ